MHREVPVCASNSDRDSREDRSSTLMKTKDSQTQTQHSF